MTTLNDPNLILPFHPSNKSLVSINQVKFDSQSSLKLLYFNARSLGGKLTELEFLLDELDIRIDVLLITETWSRPELEAAMSLHNYECFFASRSTRRGGGAAVFIHKTVGCTLLQKYCDEHNSLVAVQLDNKEKTVVVSVYRPPDSLSASIDTFLNLYDKFLAEQRSSSCSTVSSTTTQSSLKLITQSNVTPIPRIPSRSYA